MTTPDPTAQLTAIRAEIAARQQALVAETNPLIREAIETTLASLTAQRDTIARQINLGDRSIYVEGNASFVLAEKDPKELVEGDLRKAYLHRLMQQLNRVKLVGSDEASARMKLSSVYTALMTTRKDVTVHVGLATEEMARPDHETKRWSALEQLNAQRQLVLLGGPGSGKSTFANFVVLCMAGEMLGSQDANLAVLRKPLPDAEQPEQDKDEAPQPQPWEHGALLPVLIELRDFAETLPPPNMPLATTLLEDFVLNSIAPADYRPYLKKALLKKGCLVILDGLDEVPDANNRRGQVKQAVQDFVSLHGDCHVLVTSRTYAYQNQDWRLDNFYATEIAALTPLQVWAFVDGWYAHLASPHVGRLSEPDAAGKAVHLKRRIENDPRIGELTERPLLLTLIARLHLENQGDLPSDREPVYDASVKLLLNDWERQKLRQQPDGRYVPTQPSLTEYLKVNNDELQKTLQGLAFEAHRDQTDLKGLANISRDKLELALMKLARNEKANPIELETYLRDRAGILVSHGNDTYQFPHRTFQEYLAARHLAVVPDFPQPLCGLAMAEPTRWREALLLVVARKAIHAPLEFWTLIEELCPTHPSEAADSGQLWGATLAAQALLETGYATRTDVAGRDRPKRERVRLWARHIVERGLLPPLDRLIAGDALALLGDDRKGVGVVNGLPDIDWITIPDDAPFVYGEGKAQKSLSLEPFAIAKYPITFAQFQTFVDAPDGWHNPQWWQGLAADEAHRSEPTDQYYSIPNRPRDDASWYDAIAFCRWLSAKLNQSITLPTEHQFEKAARGREGNVYPCGPDYVEGSANIIETAYNVGPNNLQQTSAVGMYPQGASPYKILDVSGNVWEWCLNKYKKPDDTDLTGNDRRVLRGGSWRYDLTNARCAFRFMDEAVGRHFDVGFRIVVSPCSS